MANLILTTDCQRKCAYCFAQEDRNKKQVFSWEGFKMAVEFLETDPDNKNVNLLGGEPTLHKKFVDMLGYLLEKDFQIQVFTNAMVPEDKLHEIHELITKKVIPRKDQLYFAVNINEEKYRSEEEINLQSRFFKKLGYLSYPSFTIFENDVDLKFLVKTIEENLLDPYIRLGLAMPIVNGKNKYLHPEDYKKVAKSIIDLSENSEGITLTFDCGFPLCMFSLAEVGKLSQNKENDFMFICGQPLDIYPDLTVTNCYPLSKLHRTTIQNFKNVKELKEYFEKGFSVSSGMFGEKCRECSFFMRPCMGGCKAFYKPMVQGGS